MERPIITLTTDFGTSDAYVAAMKGVILSICSQAHIIDITHQIAPQNIFQAAFVLRDSYHCFPAETIHVVVVDPGVGSHRRAIILQTEKHTFIAPDNGVLSYVSGNPDQQIRQLVNPNYFWPAYCKKNGLQAEFSSTFHGRDVFAPAAAHIAKGIPINDFGSKTHSLCQLRNMFPAVDCFGDITGEIVYIDHFGNAISNISKTCFQKYMSNALFNASCRNLQFFRLNQTYSEVQKGEILILFNSSQLLEISKNCGNATEELKLTIGDKILLRKKENDPQFKLS